jgi:inorganic pyrophosphatase
MEAPAHVGCLIEVRIIGMITAEQTEGKTEANDRVQRVAVQSYDHEDIKAINDLSDTLLTQLEEFLISTTNSAGRNSRSRALAGRKRT